MDLQGCKYLVVGSGLSGAVIAERIAADLGEKVVVIEKRPHVGGNCYTELDSATGIEVHRYGTHIFHTSDQAVWEYLSRFISLNHYRHRVYSCHQNRVYPMPINLDTMNRFFGVNLNPDGMRQLLAGKTAAAPATPPKNLEERCISLVGTELYAAFIKGYTQKQWNTDPTRLPAEIIDRLPLRLSYHADYFNDSVQGLPREGYPQLFARLLRHKHIDLHLETDFFAIRAQIPRDCTIIFTGPIDRYFDYRFGALGWRSLRFETETLDVDDFQGTSVLNFADADIPYTRIHEFKHLHPERQILQDKTIVSREYSCNIDNLNKEPYYPVNTAADREIFRAYAQAAEDENNVIFCGRLGSYRYFDMDKVIAEALEIFTRSIKGKSR